MKTALNEVLTQKGRNPSRCAPPVSQNPKLELGALSPNISNKCSRERKKRRMILVEILQTLPFLKKLFLDFPNNFSFVAFS